MYNENEIEEMAPWLAVIITLFAAFLRLYQLGSNDLLLLETFSIWMAQHRVVDMLQWMIKIDQHPPLYYLLLHFWIGLHGDSPYFVRQLSALFSAGAIPLIYLIGKRISGLATGLAAAVFLALSLFNINVARETGMYTLLLFNTAAAMYALVRLLTDLRSIRPIGSQFKEYLLTWREPAPVDLDTRGNFSYKDMTAYQSGWRAWIFNHHWLPIRTIETDLAWVAYILFSAATLFSHNTAVFFFLTTNLFVVGLILYQRKKQPAPLPAFQAPSTLNWLKAQIAIFLLWSPWLYAFIQQTGRVDQELWLAKPGWDGVIHTLRTLLNSSIPGQANQVVTWILCGILCLGLVYYRKKISILIFLAALFVIPILGELIMSISRPIFFDRTLVWLTISLFLVLASGIAQLRFKLLFFVALGILGTYNLFVIADNYRVVQNEQWSNPAGFVANRVEKNDLIIFNSAYAQIPFDYYFIPYEEKNHLQVVRHGIPDVLNTGIPELRMTNRDLPGLVSLLSGHNRVWLVYSNDSHTDPLGLVPQTLAAQMKLTQQRDFKGGQVLFYEAP